VRLLWTLFKIVLVLVLLVPLSILVLATTLGILGALVGLAVFALRIAVVGLLLYGAIKFIGWLVRDKTPASAAAPRPIADLPRVDPYYESAMRELDRDVGPIR
jgi:hypothetical protein